MATLERVSKSSVLRELLEMSEPSLRQAVALMEAAQGASAKARQTIARDLDQSIKAAESVSHLMMQVAANHTRDIVAEAETIRGRRPARRQAAPRPPVVVPAPSARSEPEGANRPKRPPSSNRGVKS